MLATVDSFECIATLDFLVHRSIWWSITSPMAYRSSHGLSLLAVRLPLVLLVPGIPSKTPLDTSTLQPLTMGL